MNEMRAFRLSSITLTLLLFVSLPPCLEAQKSSIRTSRIDPAGIEGSLVMAGGGKLPEKIRKRFVELAGGKNARIVIIPTGGRKRGKVDETSFLQPWSSFQVASKSVLFSRPRQKINENSSVALLKKATGVWFCRGGKVHVTQVLKNTIIEKQLHALLKRGGVIGGNASGASALASLTIQRSKPTVRLADGFGFLPGTVVDRRFHKRNRKPRLTKVLRENPGYVGIGIDEETALLVQGRRLRVLGKGTVTVLLGKTKTRPLKEIVLKEPFRRSKTTIKPSKKNVRNKPRSIADLIALRRSALARTKPEFPPKNPPIPDVPKGSLIIVGGGGMPKEISKKFVELAGGPDALIVVLPTAVPDRMARRAKIPRFLTQAGARNVKILPQSKLEEVESAAYRDVLKKAKGVWFSGGRQWRFIDAYEGTSAARLFHQVLDRGGVIGGSSAGASIQGGYLARANPLGNLDIMAEGYEKGLGFLPGVAIDQHFKQRKRFKDMTQLMATYPQLLGIGLDEATAIYVKGHIALVMGRSEVHFYDRRKPIVEGKPDHESLKAGQKYDLKKREILK